MKARSVLILVVGVVLISVIATFYYCSSRIPPARVSDSKVILTDTTQPKKPDQLTVEFKVGDNKLDITSPVCVGNKKGCFKVTKKNSGQIQFLFTDPGKTWQLTEFTICKGTVKGSLDCNLKLWERLDFFVSKGAPWTDLYVTNSTGVIDLTALKPGAVDSGPTEFYLLDQNSIRAKYFYTIKACKVADRTECITTDPEIDNKGRNNRN